ncbi:MAG: hypothetical protein SO412_03590 [Erysipelotrichaceae bacterium]|nr:hypothetical protein [Erysipelotrichaceae bacterium]
MTELEKLAYIALIQIDEKRYFDELKQQNVCSIIKLSIAFSDKNVIIKDNYSH